MSFFQTVINEDMWTFYVVENDDEVVISEGAVAETDFPNKEVHFRKSEVNYRTVVHELFHVYAGYLYLKDTGEMSVHDLEEIFAAMFEDRAEKIINKAKEVYERLNSIKDEIED